MKNIQIFDPPMCCSTGVCGPDVDPELTRFAADLNWLAGRGVSVVRYNLGQEPEAFLRHRAVYETINDAGVSSLPIVCAGEDIVSSGRYPERDELASIAGLEESTILELQIMPSNGGGCCGGSTPC